jgi:hypothetical protein
VHRLRRGVDIGCGAGVAAAYDGAGGVIVVSGAP